VLGRDESKENNKKIERKERKVDIKDYLDYSDTISRVAQE
jgi:hypothetical protein